MVSRLALRRRRPGTSGSPDRVVSVLDAGGPARRSLHALAARHRTDDAHRQTVVERGADASYLRCVARAPALAKGGPARRRDAPSHAAIPALLAMDRTTTAAANAGVA